MKKQTKNKKPLKYKCAEAYIQVNKIRLHVILAGPPQGKLLIFLHGFPEFWYGWRHQIDFFGKRGYRVVVPDQRGYNLSDKPKNISDYNLDKLAKDTIGLLDHFKRKKATIIGHDWGGAVAWWTANKYPQRIDKLIILNAPHHRVFQQFLKNRWGQRLRSWYMMFFQLPLLPEMVLPKIITQVMKRSGLPGVFTSSDLSKYQKALEVPGACTGILNWYRAAFRNPPQKLASYRIKVPTLLIWGTKDAFLMTEIAQASIDFCDKGRLILMKEATHWVQHEFPEKVNSNILQFIK